MTNTENEDKIATLNLKVPSDNTFVITHNATNQYLVDPYILSSFSLFFRQKYFEEKITEYSQKDRYNERIFSIFLNLSQGIEQNISLNDIFSLQRLAESWKCQRLSAELTSLLQNQPEIEVQIAEIVDAYQITGKFPNQKSIKASMIESFIETNAFHYIDRTLLMCFMNYGKQKAIDKRKLNSFIVEHCKLIPDHSTEIVQYIDPHTLSTNELDFFCQCPGTMMLRLITDEAKRRNKTIQNKSKNEGDDSEIEEEEEDVETENTENASTVNKSIVNKGQFLKITPPLYGLFASIGIDCGGDPVLKGKIRISASSNDPSYLIQKNDEVLNVEGNDPYIQFVFPTPIKIDKYEIQNTSISTIPQWSLFGSNDFKQWELVDSVYLPKEKFEPNEIRCIKFEKETNPFSIFQLKKLETPKNNSETHLNVKYFDLFNESDFKHGASSKFKVVVTSSSNALHRLASPRHKGNWYSLNLPHQWIQFELTENLIRPDYYTLKSGRYWFLRSWEVLGSKDSNKWFLIDRKTNTNDINSKFALKLFSTEKSDECRFIRIVNTSDSKENSILCLSGVEFFGRLRKVKKSKKVPKSDAA